MPSQTLKQAQELRPRLVAAIDVARDRHYDNPNSSRLPFETMHEYRLLADSLALCDRVITLLEPEARPPRGAAKDA